MPFHRTRTPICLVIGEVFRCEILETWARLLGWKLVAPFNRFGLLLGQNLLRDRLGDRANTPRVLLASVLEIVVPAFPTLIEAHNVFLLQWMDGQEPHCAPGLITGYPASFCWVCKRCSTSSAPRLYTHRHTSVPLASSTAQYRVLP